MSGLEDIFVESNICASGSLSGVLSGRMYNRSVRCHKLLYEALARMQLSEFLSSQEKNQDTSDRLASLSNCMLQNPDTVPKLGDFEEEFFQYISMRCAESPTYRFWNGYLEMVRLLLTFLRATRESNWQEHLRTVRLMLKYFFAYDRVNYARLV